MVVTMAFSMKGFDLPRFKEQVVGLFKVFRLSNKKAAPGPHPIDEAINEGAKAINTPIPGPTIPGVEKLSSTRLNAVVNPAVDRSHQLDKLRTTAKDLGIPQSSKEVWFGQQTNKFDPLLLASQDAAHRNRRTARLSQANLTSTRLRALAESMEEHSDL